MMFKMHNTFERIKLSRQLEDTFLSLYDPEKKLPPLNSLRTIRRIMNRAIHVMKGFIEEVRTNSRLYSIVPSYYEDDLKFMDALFGALRKTNIKLAFTPSKVPPKEYDNMGVLYYHGQDIEKEDPMIVENADDYIYTPTLESKDKDPLPSTKEQTTRKPDEDMVDAISHGLRSFDLKYAKPFHPDEDLLIGITNLIFEWCEVTKVEPQPAKYHLLAELYSMMRRFVMLKTSEKKEEEN